MLLSLPRSLPLSPKLQSMHSHHRNFLSPTTVDSLSSVSLAISWSGQSLSQFNFRSFFQDTGTVLTELIIIDKSPTFHHQKTVWLVSVMKGEKIFPSLNINILNFYPFASYGETLISFLLFFSFLGGWVKFCF